MFSVWMAAVMAAQALAPANSKPAVPHSFSLPPTREVHTVEWTCGKMLHPSIAEISIIPAHKHPSIVSFEVQVMRLEVNGKPVSPETVDEVRNALAPLNSVGKLLGRCQIPGGPMLVVMGHSIDGDQYKPVHADIILK